MSFTKLTDADFAGNNIQSIVGDTVIGNAAELKRLCDAPAQETGADALNGLIDELEAVTGAESLGADAVAAGAGDTVQQNLDYLYAQGTAEAAARAAADALKADAADVYTKAQIAAKVNMTDGAIASVAGIASPGGNIAVTGGEGISVTTAGTTVTITATGTATPGAHASTHAAGGTDAITPASIGAASASELAGKADKSTAFSTTLTAESWSGESAPYGQTVIAPGVTATSNNEILPGADVTQAELEALQAANLVDGGQEEGYIFLKAWGDRPAIDLPIRVIVRGDA